MTTTLSLSDLRQFTGSETWYRHALVRHVLYTDGARYLAEQGSAYWLLNEIAFAQVACKPVQAEPFQVWKLVVQADQTAELTCEDGNSHVVFAKIITYTDFPLVEVILWFADKTIFLPSEY